MKARRIIPLLAACVYFLWPVAASCKTDARCGLSAGVVGGLSIPTNAELRDEFRYMYRIEVNAKYYFLYLLSLSGDLGYEYGQGAPKVFLHEGAIKKLDGRGVSFSRALPFWATLRVEPFRRYTWNPYVGAAAGGKYLALERRGRAREIPVSASGNEWLLGWMGLAGVDYLFTDFIFARFEVRYSSLPSRTEDFLRGKDYGTYDALLGLNIYF